jgi:hypothetical protein
MTHRSRHPRASATNRPAGRDVVLVLHVRLIGEHGRSLHSFSTGSDATNRRPPSPFSHAAGPSPQRPSSNSMPRTPIYATSSATRPSRLKHHQVAHAGEELGVSLVSPRRSRHLPVSSRTVVCCAKNKQRCGHRASIGKTGHQIQSGTRALGLHTGRAGLDDGFGGMRAEQVFTGQGRGVEQIGGTAVGIGAQHDPRVTADHAQRDSSYPLRRGGRMRTALGAWCFSRYFCTTKRRRRPFR